MLPEFLPKSPSQYPEFLSRVHKIPNKALRKKIFRLLCREDLYFLLRYVLSTKQIPLAGRCAWEHPWLFDRCREVQNEPNGYIDIWAREHFKTSLISFGLTVQDILNDPEITVGLFSHSRPLAKRVLRQIKTEFEKNSQLKSWFPDIFFQDPANQSPKWSEDDGIIVKRKGNPAAATVEAWGLLDSQPTGKHFKVRVYDDVVDRDTVSTPEMIAKLNEAWQLSSNLGMDGGFERYIGTRYANGDTYRTIIDSGAVKTRIYPCMEPPNIQDGVPVLFSREYLEDKYKKQGAFTFSAQMLCDPTVDSMSGFKADYIQYYKKEPIEEREGKNVYILVDAANAKKKRSDYTSIWVIGAGEDHNFYVLDSYRDRLNLVERTTLLFMLHTTWKPLEVRYESYGMESDKQHIEYVQELRKYRFHITPVRGKASKNDRISGRLGPLFEAKRIFFPMELRHKDYQGKEYDSVGVFLNEEYKAFPVGLHDDMLDSLARIAEDDLPVLWPHAGAWKPKVTDRWALPDRRPEQAISWMGA